MSFIVNPVVILEADTPTPPLSNIFENLFDSMLIPVCIITDENDAMYQNVMATKPPEYKLKYLIIAIQYLNIFEA